MRPAGYWLEPEAPLHEPRCGLSGEGRAERDDVVEPGDRGCDRELGDREANAPPIDEETHARRAVPGASGNGKRSNTSRRNATLLAKKIACGSSAGCSARSGKSHARANAFPQTPAGSM